MIASLQTLKSLRGGTLTLKLCESFPGVPPERFPVETIELEIVSATEKDYGVYVSSSFIMHGPPHVELGQNTYCFHSEETGDFSMFIVPVGEKTEMVDGRRMRLRMVYQAIFSTLKQS